MSDDERMKEIMAEVAETHRELSKGVCCECGGIMRATGNQMLCPNNPNSKTLGDSGGFHDKLEVRCERCGKTDWFVKQVAHLNKLVEKK